MHPQSADQERSVWAEKMLNAPKRVQTFLKVEVGGSVCKASFPPLDAFDQEEKKVV